MTPWRSYQHFTGAPLTNDAAPNVTPPAAARVFTADAGQAFCLVQLLDGTSATATVWTSADGGTTWTAVSGGAGTIGTSVPTCLNITAGQKTFVQLTAIAGNPTACVVLPGEALPDVLRQLTTRAALQLGDVSIHADVDQVETKLDTLHTDIGTTIHGDLATTLAGKMDTIHADHTSLLAALKAYNSFATITPHDSNPIAATKGVLVGGAGNLVCKGALPDAGTTTIPVLAGYIYPISVILVTTATTATGLVACY